MSDLDAHLTVIRSGVTPAQEGTGRLSPERARELERQLRELHEARGRAWAEVSGRSSHGPR